MLKIFCVVLLASSPALAGALEYTATPFSLERPDEAHIEEVPATAVSPDGSHIYVFNRGKRALLAYDKKGRFIEEIGRGLFVTPHSLRVDKHGNLWTADTGNHLVLKFSPRGKVLMVLGKKNTASKGWFDRDYNQTFLNKPSDIAFDQSGNIYVADGGNFRIVKYSPTGEVLLTFGDEGEAPGQFNFPHSILVDQSDRLLVADRENQRIQLFNLDGEFQSEWADIGYPYMIAQSDNGDLWITDARRDLLVKLSADGKTLGQFGEPGKKLGQYGFLHGVTPYLNGLLVSDILNWKIEFLIPEQAL